MRIVAIVALVALAACSTTTTTLTQKVITLNFPETPSVAIVTRGPADSAALWAASLRAISSATVVTELTATSGDMTKVCDAVHQAAPAQHVDEILLLDTSVRSDPVEPCIDEQCAGGSLTTGSPESCHCIKRRYEKVTTTLSASLVAVRVSSCQVVATFELPAAKADSTPHAPIEFPIRGEGIANEIAATLSADETESQRLAVAELARVVPTHKWTLFSRSAPTVRTVDAHTFHVDDPNKRLAQDRSYWVKTPAGTLQPSARVARIEGTTATLETTGETTLEPRDELHITNDVRKIMVYGGVAGGTVRAQDASHGTAAAALAGRVSFETAPIMFELRLEGDLLPGLDAARWGVGGAGGFRYQLGPIAPVAFGELGVGAAYQGRDGARAYGVTSGLGAGLELSIGRWSLLADVRHRWFHMGDWEDPDGKPLAVKYPDTSWISTTIHVGIGNRF